MFTPYPIESKPKWIPRKTMQRPMKKGAPITSALRESECPRQRRTSAEIVGSLSVKAA